MDLSDIVALEGWERLVYRAWNIAKEAGELQKEIVLYTEQATSYKGAHLWPDVETAQGFKELKSRKFDLLEEKSSIAKELADSWAVPVAEGWIRLDDALIFSLTGNERNPSIRVEVLRA